MSEGCELGSSSSSPFIDLTGFSSRARNYIRKYGPPPNNALIFNGPNTPFEDLDTQVLGHVTLGLVPATVTVLLTVQYGI